MKQLTETVFIDCDDLCYTLYEKKIAQKGKNAGKERFEALGYYSKAEQVNNALIERGIKEFIKGEWKDMEVFIKKAQDRFFEEKAKNKWR